MTQVEKLNDIVVERAPKLPIPLLVIGLGGTGIEILKTIKSTFAQRYKLPVDHNGQSIPIPEHTAYLAIDTDSCAGRELDDGEFIDIAVPGLPKILDPGRRNINLSDAEKEWVDPRIDIGYCRQAGRFMLNRKYTEVSTAIRAALFRISTVRHGNPEQFGRIEVVICTGICGYTGSGIFLDIPQIVRHIIATEPCLVDRDYKITGYIVMPDVSLPRASRVMQDRLRMNGYAALKELDFWMNVGEHKTPYAMKFSDHARIKWTLPPFDNCVLMSGCSVTGRMFENPEQVVGTTVAETLLHYFAEGYTRGEYDGGYSYYDYQDSLRVTMEIMPKRLPVNYKYRAIGSYSKRMPNKKIMYFEGSQLFDTFLPKRDGFGHLAPDDALIRDGLTEKRAQQIIGNAKQFHAHFASVVELPNFCKGLPMGMPLIAAMQQMPVHPHDQENTKPTPWIDSIVKPAAGKAAEFYLEGAWKRFEAFCESVISDPELGPFSLRDYLEHAGQGLISALETQVNHWVTMARKFGCDLGGQKQACVSAWPDFVHPPILGTRHAAEVYLQHLNNYYAGLRKTVFMEAHASAAQRLLLRVRAYLATSLKPMCNDVEHLYEIFTNIPDDDLALGSDVLDIEVLKPRIVSQFCESNENKRVTLSFLKMLCTESFKTMPTHDDAGVTFLYTKEGYEGVLAALKEVLNDYFGGINNQSLDALMEQAAGDDPMKQQQFMMEIARSVLTGAQPLFIQDAAVSNEAEADYSCLSVPENAPGHIAYFNNIFGRINVQIKGSAVRDHVNCLTAWDGLPLYRYGMMQDLRQNYATLLADPWVSAGLHLVSNGDLGADYTKNWACLPEPRPFYFFSQNGDASETTIWNQQRDLTARAIQCGMLKVDTSNIAPVFSLRMFWDDARQNVPVPAKELIDQVSGILAPESDPADGTAQTPEQKLVKLKAFEAQAMVTTLRPGKSSECMAIYLGLVGQDINPWAPDIANDPIRKAQAEENHQRLSEVMAAAIFSRQPHLMLIMKNQIEGFEAIAKAMDDLGDMNKI